MIDNSTTSSKGGGFLFFRYGCCVPTWDVLWMTIVLFLVLVSVCLICCFVTWALHESANRRLARREQEVEAKFKDEEETRRVAQMRIQLRQQELERHPRTPRKLESLDRLDNYGDHRKYSNQQPIIMHCPHTPNTHSKHKNRGQPQTPRTPQTSTISDQNLQIRQKTNKSKMTDRAKITQRARNTPPTSRVALTKDTPKMIPISCLPNTISITLSENVTEEMNPQIDPLMVASAGHCLAKNGLPLDPPSPYQYPYSYVQDSSCISPSSASELMEEEGSSGSFIQMSTTIHSSTSNRGSLSASSQTRTPTTSTPKIKSQSMTPRSRCTDAMSPESFPSASFSVSSQNLSNEPSQLSPGPSRELVTPPPFEANYCTPPTSPMTSGSRWEPRSPTATNSHTRKNMTPLSAPYSTQGAGGGGGKMRTTPRSLSIRNSPLTCTSSRVYPNLTRSIGSPKTIPPVNDTTNPVINAKEKLYCEETPFWSNDTFEPLPTPTPSLKMGSSKQNSIRAQAPPMVDCQRMRAVDEKAEQGDGQGINKGLGQGNPWLFTGLPRQGSRNRWISPTRDEGDGKREGHEESTHKSELLSDRYTKRTIDELARRRQQQKRAGLVSVTATPTPAKRSSTTSMHTVDSRPSLIVDRMRDFNQMGPYQREQVAPREAKRYADEPWMYTRKS